MPLDPIRLPPTVPAFLVSYFRELRKMEARVNVLTNPQGDQMIQPKVTEGVSKVALRNGWQLPTVDLVQNGQVTEVIMPVQTSTTGA